MTRFQTLLGCEAMPQSSIDTTSDSLYDYLRIIASTGSFSHINFWASAIASNPFEQTFHDRFPSSINLMNHPHEHTVK